MMTMLLAAVLPVIAGSSGAVPLDKTGTSGSEFRLVNEKTLVFQGLLEHCSSTAEREGFSDRIKYWRLAH